MIDRRVFSKYLSSGFLFAANGSGFAGADTAIPVREDSWSGEFTLVGATWRVNVVRFQDGSAQIDVPSMWRAGARIAGAFHGDRFSFELPYALGRIVGRIIAGRLIGQVSRADGAHAAINWNAVQSASAIREDLRFEVNGVTIAATLVRPNGRTLSPLVIVLHGGGDSSRADSPPYTFWGEHLVRLGYAVLLYDKRGNGQSTGNWREVGFGERAADVAAMARVLSSRPDVDSARIGLLAVSQGGWVAIRAAQLSKQISFAALIASPAVTPYEADTYASWVASRGAGLTAAEADERLVLWRAYVDYVRSGGLEAKWATLLDLVRAARERPWFARRPFDPGPRNDPFVSWYRLVADYDPRQALAESNIPMIWVYGAADTQSDVGKNVAELTQLRDRLNKRLEIAVLAGGDHSVGQRAAVLGGENTYFTAAPGFLETIEQWLRLLP